MATVLDFALGVLIVASLVTIIVYAVIFLSVTAWTALRGSRRDPMEEELDAFLAELWELEGDHFAVAARPSRKSS
jgi:hypothetical protein